MSRTFLLLSALTLVAQDPLVIGPSFWHAVELQDGRFCIQTDSEVQLRASPDADTVLARYSGRFTRGMLSYRHLLLISTRQGVEILDCNAAAIHPVGRIPGGTHLDTRLAIAHNHLFVCGFRKVAIYNMDGPKLPIEVAAINVAQGVSDMALGQDELYIGNREHLRS